MNRAESYQRMYQPSDWFDVQEAQDVISFYPEAGTLMDVYRNAGSISVAERAELLPVKIDRIFEFGSGTGAGLIALNMFAQSRGESVTVLGSERTRKDQQVCLMVAEILDRVVDVRMDGISTMHEAPGEFDFILANMFGPSYDSQDRVAAVVPTAVRSLSSTGSMIINSDADTMENVIDWVRENLSKDQVQIIGEEELPSGFINMPHVIVRK